MGLILFRMVKLVRCNLAPSTVALLRHYLGERKQQTRANNKVSEQSGVDRGVPQGSVCGPLLFITYVDDVCDVIDNSGCFLYADDLALIVSGKDVDRIAMLMQQDLDKVAQWCRENKLTVNTQKTQVLWSYSPRAIPDLTRCALFLNGAELDVVTSFCYLGATLDTHMTMTPNLKKTINLTQVRITQLRGIRKRSNKSTAVQVYLHMIRSILDYCCFLHDGGPVWAIRKLQTLQNNALRVCESIRDPRGVDIAALHTRNKVTKLEVTRRHQLLSLMHREAQDENQVVAPVRVLRGGDKLKLRTQRVKKDIYEKSPYHRGLAEWNALDAAVQHTKDKASFMNSIKSA